MEIDIKFPIFVRYDNVSAIFMAENSSSGVEKLNIDTRYHFERVKDRLINYLLLNQVIIMIIC
jgi:hypothetical protein